jgi:serine/threonine protein kinase
VATQRILASKYCLLYELGRGGMGSVWLAEHLTLRSKVAVKLIDPRLAADAEIRRRFEREAMAAAALRSPHVVQVLDFGIDGSPYLVMELLTGETLGARLSRGVLSPKDTWKVTSQIGRAMMRAHQQGIVHRDLKPDNIFLVEEDEDFFVKVLDFGIAKALVPERPQPTTEITRSGAMVGTPHYMSPEQAEGRAVDACSDLWSMGVIAFECITGLRPFDGSSLPAILRAICFDPIVVPSSAAPVPPGFDGSLAPQSATAVGASRRPAHSSTLSNPSSATRTSTRRLRGGSRSRLQIQDPFAPIPASRQLSAEKTTASPRQSPPESTASAIFVTPL